MQIGPRFGDFTVHLKPGVTKQQWENTLTPPGNGDAHSDFLYLQAVGKFLKEKGDPLIRWVLNPEFKNRRLLTDATLLKTVEGRTVARLRAATGVVASVDYQPFEFKA